MKRACVYVYGIGKGPYLKQAVQTVNPEFYSRYEYNRQVGTERDFDNHKTWAYYVPVVGDSINDVFSYFRDDAARIDACRRVRRKIFKLQDQGYLVDLVCHSLGCQIAICSGPNDPQKRNVEVENTYLMASPMGFGINTWPLKLRSKVIKHAETYSNGFTTKNLYYYWSNEDLVSKVNPLTGDYRIGDLLQSLSINEIKHVDLDCDHDSKYYATHLR